MTTPQDARAATVVTVSRNAEYSFSKPNRDEIVLLAGLGVEGDVHSGTHVRHRSRVGRDPSQPNLRQVHLIHAELFDDVGGKGYDVSPGQLGENVTTRGVDLLALPRGTVLRFGHPDGEGAPAGGGEGAPAGGEGAPAGGGGVGEAVRGVLDAAGSATLNEATANAVATLVAVTGQEDLPGSADARPAVVVMGLRNPCPQIDNFQPGLLGEIVFRDPEGRIVRRAGVLGVVLRGGPVHPGDPITVDLPAGPHLPLQPI